LSVALSVEVEGFIKAASVFLDGNPQSENQEFIKEWKASFEKCLAMFKVPDDEGDGDEERGSDASDSGT
jgi:hypothetical protein